MLKRAIDFVISAAALLLLAPVCVAIAIWIKADSPGPVFYAQVRVGRRGRLFKVHKFRSMVVGADRLGPPLTGKNDPRMSRVGRVLRLLRLDELPQLFDVLKGDMSLVGPRPEIPWMVERYTEEQREILEVRPGITGPTQLLWMDESDDYPAGVDPAQYYTQKLLPEKLRSDLEYVRTCSLGTDLLYLIHTPLAIAAMVSQRLNPSLAIALQQGARLAADGAAVAAANVVAFGVRFDWAIPEKEMKYLVYGLPLACGAYLLPILALRIYKSIWRYTGVEDLWRLVEASFFGSVLHVMFLLQIGWRPYPRWVFMLSSLLSVVFMADLRLLVRAVVERWQSATPMKERRVIIVGAGKAGESMAREICRSRALGYVLIGFVDDDPLKQGTRLHGLPVLGPAQRLPELVQWHKIHEVIIAVPSASTQDMRRIGLACIEAGVDFRALPSFVQLVRGAGKLRYLCKVNVEDLLQREPLSINRTAIAECLRAKRIMVTGAGGSVGSELCRQIIQFDLESLIMVERAENALHAISLEMKERSAKAAVTAALADIKHISRMSEIFERTRPQVVFHAAAYKHVPILEDHPAEAVLNNVIGTKRLSDVAQRFGVDTFVLISTDKAVRPSSLMGATKRVCEMYVTALNRVFRRSNGANGGPRFLTVRFGNVLASAGSIVPIFQKQIEDGGPITITDPQATRYFLTIPEAVGLVLQSACMTCDEDLFILNMGDPIRIDDLANDLIMASGVNPANLPKRYTGLRQGEKLHERLWDNAEQILPSGHERIFAVRQPPIPLAALAESVACLETLAMAGDVPGLLRQITHLVPSYRLSYDAHPVAVCEHRPSIW